MRWHIYNRGSKLQLAAPRKTVVCKNVSLTEIASCVRRKGGSRGEQAEHWQYPCGGGGPSKTHSTRAKSAAKNLSPRRVHSHWSNEGGGRVRGVLCGGCTYTESKQQQPEPPPPPPEYRLADTSTTEWISRPRVQFICSSQKMSSARLIRNRLLCLGAVGQSRELLRALPLCCIIRLPSRYLHTLHANIKACFVVDRLL